MNLISHHTRVSAINELKFDYRKLMLITELFAGQILSFRINSDVILQSYVTDGFWGREWQKTTHSSVCSMFFVSCMVPERTKQNQWAYFLYNQIASKNVKM